MDSNKFDVIGEEPPLQDTSDPKVSEDTKNLEENRLNEPEKQREKQRLQEQQQSLLQQKQIDLSEEALAEKRTLRRLRTYIAVCIFLLITAWLIGVIYLVFLGSYEVHYFQGNCAEYDLHSLYDKFKMLPEGCEFAGTEGKTYLDLPDNIMIALITTTTINVLGLAFIVANWLFPSDKKHQSPPLPSEPT